MHDSIASIMQWQPMNTSIKPQLVTMSSSLKNMIARKSIKWNIKHTTHKKKEKKLQNYHNLEKHRNSSFQIHNFVIPEGRETK